MRGIEEQEEENKRIGGEEQKNTMRGIEVQEERNRRIYTRPKFMFRKLRNQNKFYA